MWIRGTLRQAWIPAFAGMTKVDSGFILGKAASGMTSECPRT